MTDADKSTDTKRKEKTIFGGVPNLFKMDNIFGGVNGLEEQVIFGWGGGVVF